MLSITPLQVQYFASIDDLPATQFLLLGLPVTDPHPATLPDALINHLHSHADSVLLALPSEMMLFADNLRACGIAGCIAKPVSLTVLAVEDNPADLELIDALLEEQVQNIVLCDNAEQAIREARLHKLDVILMDIQMPNIDSIRASEIIRNLPPHANTSIVAVTAHTRWMGNTNS